MRFKMMMHVYKTATTHRSMCYSFSFLKPTNQYIFLVLKHLSALDKGLVNLVLKAI